MTNLERLNRERQRDRNRAILWDFAHDLCIIALSIAGSLLLAYLVLSYVHWRIG